MSRKSMLPWFAALAVAGATGCGTRAPTSPTPVVAATPAAPAALVTPAAPASSGFWSGRTAQQEAFDAALKAKPAPFEGEGWQPLFDGKTLTGWKETPFAGRGETELKAGALLLHMGDPFTGLNYTNPVPTMNYEVALDAMRFQGTDFFCGLTVPVKDTFCSLIVGGWGGSLVGISSLDGMDASENSTTKFLSFEANRWYRIRLRVTPDRLEAWIDADKVVDADLAGKRVALRPGDIENSKPFGVACWQTGTALREIRLRSVEGPADPRRRRTAQ